MKIKEDAPTVNTGAIPNPADTVMGPRKKKKRKNNDSNPVLLRRFKDYYNDKGIG